MIHILMGVNIYKSIHMLIMKMVITNIQMELLFQKATTLELDRLAVGIQ